MLGVRTPTARSWEMSVTRANLRAAASRTRERYYEARKLQDFSLEQVQAFRTAFDHIGSRFKASTGWLQEAMKSINVSLSSQQLRDILYVVTNEAIPGKGMEFEEFVFLSLFLARYFQKINVALEEIDGKHPNRGLHVRYDTDVKKPRPKTSSACTSMIAKNNEELPVESKRPHRCKAKIIDVSNASPMIVKQRLQCTVKDYGFYPKNTRPADVLVQDWVRGSPAAIDITVTSPLTPAMLRDASTSAGSAAYAAECRKHEANDTKCQELGWTCIPLAVETFGHWGKEAQAVFSRLASFIPSIELVPNPVS
ncbi:hypothetical protein EMCRGX_G029116 [Ephydatia muelleri]